MNRRSLVPRPRRGAHGRGTRLEQTYATSSTPIHQPLPPLCTLYLAYSGFGPSHERSVKSSCSRNSVPLKVMSELVSCQLCSYFASNEEQLLRHVCQIHEHDPNFLIYCSTCSRSFTKLDSFKKHKSRSSECSYKEDQPSLTPPALSTAPDHNNGMSPTSNCDGGDSSSFVLAPRPQSTKWRAATFILGIKEKHLISQAAVDTVLLSTTSLVNGLLQDVVTGLREELPEGGKEVLDKKIREGSFDLQPFRGLETAYLQGKYFRECFELVVSKLLVS